MHIHSRSLSIFDILGIGVSRIVAEDHWITDVLGGYLEGMLELYIFIMLFRWTTEWQARRRAKKQAEKFALGHYPGKFDHLVNHCGTGWLYW
jgi:membrane-associated phospholipid phosphatase